MSSSLRDAPETGDQEPTAKSPDAVCPFLIWSRLFVFEYCQSKPAHKTTRLVSPRTRVALVRLFTHTPFIAPFLVAGRLYLSHGFGQGNHVYPDHISHLFMIFSSEACAFSAQAECDAYCCAAHDACSERTPPLRWREPVTSMFAACNIRIVDALGVLYHFSGPGRCPHSLTALATILFFLPRAYSFYGDTS